MSRSDRIQPLKDLADQRERDAGTGVAAARRALEDREQQLAQLMAYRDEYAARASREGAADAVRLQNYHVFLDRLTTAIAQQREQVAAAREELERHTEQWRERRVEAASLGKAIDRMAVDERRAADRREQRESDERALQRLLGRRD